MSKPEETRIAIIGFGEVGQILAADLHERGFGQVMVWDKQFPDRASRPSEAARRMPSVRVATGLCAALTNRNLVISAVTAGECVAAAREAALAIAPNAYYLDLNSVAPEAKSAAARLIDGAGGRYIEAAVMAPIGPKRIASPMLLGGPHSSGFLATATDLGFAGMEHFSDTLGRASAAKMCRSVIVKGLEALMTESLLAARHYGVEQTVLGSLRDFLPIENWPRLARYMISRSLEHGGRRAEEMCEVARTVADAGIEPWMSTACASRQDWAATHHTALQSHELADMLDAILAKNAPVGKPQ